ncbi:hypothetical protein HMPREF0262_01350 [Clostridium sp. ATCC 29733]|nr:hypothetical protein HMPREF0262_01350 [Clostridium sp. ATCC 29733]
MFSGRDARAGPVPLRDLVKKRGHPLEYLYPTGCPLQFLPKRGPLPRFPFFPARCRRRDRAMW